MHLAKIAMQASFYELQEESTGTLSNRAIHICIRLVRSQFSRAQSG
jgi:hypothetical protein